MCAYGSSCDASKGTAESLGVCLAGDVDDAGLSDGDGGQDEEGANELHSEYRPEKNEWGIWNTGRLLEDRKYCVQARVSDKKGKVAEKTGWV
jgi:hypothetical protein